MKSPGFEIWGLLEFICDSLVDGIESGDWVTGLSAAVCLVLFAAVLAAVILGTFWLLHTYLPFKGCLFGVLVAFSMWRVFVYNKSV